MELLDIDVPFVYRFKCCFCGEHSHSHIAVNSPDIQGGRGPLFLNMGGIPRS